MDKTIFDKLFMNMCCNVCARGFDSESVNIKREEKGLIVVEIICPDCGKNFGLAILAAENDFSVKDEDALDFMPCPAPITFDEIYEAHDIIRKSGNDWKKYIPKEYRDNG